MTPTADGGTDYERGTQGQNPATGNPATQVDKLHVGPDAKVKSQSSAVKDNSTLDNAISNSGNGSGTIDLSPVVSAVSATTGAVSSVGATIVSSLSQVKDSVSIAATSISSQVTASASVVAGQVASSSSAIQSSVTSAAAAVKGSVDSLKDSLAGVSKDATLSAVDADVKAAKGSVDAVKDAVVALPGQLVTPIASAVAPVATAVDAVRDAVQAVPGQIAPPITQAVGEVKTAVDQSTDAVKSVADAVKNQSITVTGDGGTIQKPTLRRESLSDAFTGLYNAFLNSPLIAPFTGIGDALSSIGGGQCDMSITMDFSMLNMGRSSSNFICELVEPQYSIIQSISDFIWIMGAAFLFLKA